MTPGTWMPTVPAALAGLLAALKAWPALEGVEVLDGPAVSASTELEVIAVGFADERMAATGEYPEPARPVVDATSQVEGLAVMPQEENYTVKSMIAVLNGSGDVPAARTRAYQLLGMCASAMAADKTLGGAVAMSRIGGHTMLQEQTPRGAIVTIYWETVITAYTKKVS